MRKEAETEVKAAVIAEKPHTELGAGSCLTAKANSWTPKGAASRSRDKGDGGW